jgi:tetratricopeptide (TPR) repeat protein
MIIAITDMKIKSYYPFFVLVIFSLLVYLNTFQSPFHFDDETALTGNVDIRSWEGISKYSFISRYVLYLTFYLNYLIGEFNVIGYHIVNIILHILVSILIYLITDLTLNRVEPKNHPSLKNIPLLSALIFSIHPINTESVTYIISRSSILSALFYLLSLFLFIKGYTIKTGYNATLKKGLLYLSSTASFILGIGTKEDTVTLPIILLLYLFYFFYRERGIINFVKEYILSISIPVILLITYLLYRFYLFGWGMPTTMSADILEYITPWYYFLTELKVIVFYYLRLLLLPINLNVDPDIPMATSLSEPAVFLSIISIFILLFLSYRSYSLSKPVSFSILWFLIALLPTSSVIPLLDFAAEHRLYLPAVGFSICYASLINKINRYTIGKIIIIITIFLFSFGTVKRNVIWNDAIGLWQDAVKKSPNKARAYYNLGIEYAQQKRFREALMEFKRGIRILPNHLLSHLMLGKMYKEEGMFRKTIDEMKIVLDLKPEKIDEHVDTYLELSNAYIKLGDFNRAEESIKSGLQLNPKNEKLHNNMATIYGEKGLFDDAIHELKTAISIKHDYVMAYCNLGLLYEKKGLIKDAIREFKRAIEVDPDNAESHLFFGEFYKRNGSYDLALHHLTTSIKLDSDKERVKNTEMIIREMRMGLFSPP